MARRELMRLPFGGFTEDTDEYMRAWRALGQRAEKFFEGYEAIAYDPMVRLDIIGRHSDPKNALRTTYIELTPEAVRALRVPKES